MKTFDIASASGHLLTSMKYVHEPLKEIVFEKTKKTGDFSQLIKILIRNKKLFVNLYSPECEKICKRAVQIRNEICHQDDDASVYEHNMECLAKLASLIGKPDIEQKFRALVSIPETKKLCVECVINVPKSELLQLKNEDAAMNCYTRAIKMYPKEASLYSNRAECELKLKKYSLAREDAEDAIDLDPNQVQYYHVLVKSLISLNQHKEALGACENGLKIDPRDKILLIEKRNCNAFITAKSVDAGNPRPWSQDYDILQKKVWKQCPTYLQMAEKLTPNPEDIKVITFAEMISYRQMKLHLAKAHEPYLGSGKLQKTKKEALKIFQKAAKMEDAEGLYNTGCFYASGEGGLSIDYAMSGELFSRAAAQKAFYQFEEEIIINIGVADAENSIGIRFCDGEGADVNDNKAFMWFIKSAEYSHPSRKKQSRYFPVEWPGL